MDDIGGFRFESFKTDELDAAIAMILNKIIEDHSPDNQSAVCFRCGSRINFEERAAFFINVAKKKDDVCGFSVQIECFPCAVQIGGTLRDINLGDDEAE